MTPNPAYAYLALAICAEVIATSALKAADGFTKPLPTLVTVVGYGTPSGCCPFA